MDYENTMTYIEVSKPDRLVYSHSEPKFLHEVTFTEVGGKTLVTVRMLFESAGLRERVVSEYGAIDGLNETLDRLSRHLRSV